MFEFLRLNRIFGNKNLQWPVSTQRWPIHKGTQNVQSITLRMLLLMYWIELNPGPNHDLKLNLTIRTYNCNGLGNVNKLRRVLNKAYLEVSKGGTVLLQETHVKNDNIEARSHWIQSCLTIYTTIWAPTC